MKIDRELKLILLVLAVGLFAGCSGGIDEGGYPEIQISIGSDDFGAEGGAFACGHCAIGTEEDPAEWGHGLPGLCSSATPSSCAYAFGAALVSDQTQSFEKVRITNTGTATLVISHIGWLKDADTGSSQVNPHVTLSIPGDVFTIGQELTIAPGTDFDFSVTYAPSEPRDYSRSLLQILSNARRDVDRAPVPEVVLSLAIASKSAVPEVNPPNYTFSNATPTKPETQTFVISNNQDLGAVAFEVTSLSLENIDDEFTLTNLPSLPLLIEGNEVCSSTEQAGCSVKFDVRYKPVCVSGTDDCFDNDFNAILVGTSVTTDLLRVPMSTALIVGGYELSYQHELEFDFSNVNTVSTRTVQLISTGPGPLKVKEPSIEEAEANDVFLWQAFKPATSEGGQDELISSWPRALTGGNSLLFDITYQPPSGGAEPPNGVLVIPVETPENKTIEIDLLAGTPKPKISFGPATGNVSVTADKAAGATGSRNVVVYNDGNGDLTLKDVSLTNAFNAPAEVFSLASPPAADTVVPPHSLLVLQLNWDAAQIKKLDGDTETLTVTYYDPYTGGDEPLSMGLFAKDSEGMEVPIANPGDSADYAGAVVGEPIYLDGSASSEGAFDFPTDSHFWYLVAKPAGSTAKLNETGSSVVEFVPDVAGTYEVELVVNAAQQSNFLLSEAATVSFSVAAE